MKNKEVADIFEKMALILEFRGENVFKVRAYQRAARVVRDLTEDIEALHRRGELEGLPGVGKAMAEKISQYLTTGRMAKYEEAREGISDGLIEMLRVPGLGPKTLALIHKELGVDDLGALKAAIQGGRLRGLPGMGAKKEENILRGINLLKASQEKIPLGLALPLVEEVIAALKEKSGTDLIFPAGSLRRMKEAVGDIDILAAASQGRDLVRAFSTLPMVKEVLAAGKTKGSVIVEGGIQVDLRVVPRDSLGAALQYFTGSKAHNIRLRDIAIKKNLKLNEYGVFRGDEKVAGREEDEVYRALGLHWIPPELREDRGEVEASHSLPELVDYGDIQGDLHCHSRWSDGTATIEEMARKAKSMGYKYLAITDHSQSLKVAGGLTEEEVLRQVEEIARVNAKLRGFRVLSGTEVDIKNDGTLDFSDEVLSQLDLVIAALHSGFRQDARTLTRRITSAMENPHVDIIAHPTGRLLSSREPYGLELEGVMEKAAETGTALEINAYMDRLDLDDLACRKAQEFGVTLSLGTDAHNPDQLWMMKLGLAVARRGWLERGSILNARSHKELAAWTRKKGGGGA